MTPLRRIALIGNSLPRRCGIATFTTDLERALSTSRPHLETSIVAMTDHGQAYDYPASVALQVKDDSIEEYVRAAAFLNAGRFDVVCLQHEFGIFGGEGGAHILELLSRLTMPVVTTLHTVLAKPTTVQRAVIELESRSADVIEVDTDGIYFVAPFALDDETAAQSLLDEIGKAMPEGIRTSPRNSREKSVCRSSNVTDAPRFASR